MGPGTGSGCNCTHGVELTLAALNIVRPQVDGTVEGDEVFSGW